MLQFMGIHTQVEHGADEHVAADTAEDVEIKNIHSYFSSPQASALIWLAA